MQRLTGLDAGFLYMETPTQHLHTLKISVLDPATVPGGYSFEKVKEVLAGRLHLLPPFRRRVVPVPLGLHHPVWIEDPDFDLERHVRRATVAAPGGTREFDELTSEIASRPLDRSRPLWELWVAEGLADGHVGFVAKIHHCVADGVKAAELLLAIVDAEPDASDPAPPESPWRPERLPSRAELIWRALVERLRQLLAIPALLRRTAAGLRRVAQRRRAGHRSPPLPFSAPDLSFNRALTPRRLYATTSLPLAQVKEVRRAFDVTVNDVVLALCTSALRRWLLEHRQLPDRPLVTGVPVSTRTDSAADLANSVSNLFAALPVQLHDPVERLQEIHTVMQAAKEHHQALGPEMLADWSELTPALPFAAVVRLYSRLGLANRHRPPINLVVSNVPGPRDPIYVAGARMVGLFSMGPILENVGLNITVWSYLDQLNAGAVACPEAIPDLARLVGWLADGLDELQAASRMSEASSLDR